MTREQLLGHSQVSTIVPVRICVASDVDEADIQPAVKSLLKLIYTYNEDGTISGAVQKYLSSNVAPEVREYIRQNILSPSQSVDSYIDVPDDMISELVARRGESSYDYAQRVRQYLDTAVSSHDEVKRQIEKSKSE